MCSSTRVKRRLSARPSRRLSRPPCRSSLWGAVALDLVDPGRTGWLYQPGDLEGMRAAVEHLITDDDARSRAAAEAHQEVQGRTWEAICNQLIGHYARAVDVNDRLQANRARQYITSNWASRALLPGTN